MIKKKTRKKATGLKAEDYCAFVGTYKLGHEWVSVYTIPESGGSFSVTPANKSEAFMNIGHAWGEAPFDDLFRTLLHEALEMAMTRMQCRFDPSLAVSNSHGGYMFIMNHEQFAEASAMAAKFALDCLDDLRFHHSTIQHVVKRGTLPKNMKLVRNGQYFKGVPK